MFATAAAVVTGVASPTVHAEASRIQFLTPSGNIGCQLDRTPEGSSFAWCKANEHSWVAPQSSVCPRGNLPGAIGEPGGEDVQLAEGQAPCFGFVMSQLFFSGQYAPPIVAYGERRSMGAITCSVEPAGVTCTDGTTGKFFRLSRDSYLLG
ncbi:hypothetical protein EAH80_14880 [Mycobacterium hodleri]|uniref:Lipoprotein LppI n=1 Tax=Mycolicibacterium hodleri TaxID=49897 RepID=A0A502E868_9MYCO|nr:hypothetical protein EAH80_14880 [Mycolicibacterium hodleri]